MRRRVSAPTERPERLGFAEWMEAGPPTEGTKQAAAGFNVCMVSRWKTAEDLQVRPRAVRPV